MGERIRLVVFVSMTVVILALANLQIAGKERTISEGVTMLLRLAPADPRSLLQGDYMALRYAITAEVAAAAERAGVRDGKMIVELDENQEAHFVALFDGQSLADGQHLLQFRKRGETVRLASDAWFFEEGEGETYQGARFGELRVAADGAAVLTAMRDERHERLQ